MEQGYRSTENVKYDVVDSYYALMNKVTQQATLMAVAITDSYEHLSN